MLSPPTLETELEPDRGKDRIVELAHDPPKDLEQGLLGRVLSRHDGEQGPALRRARVLVNDRLGFAIAFMQQAGPGGYLEKAQAIELGVSVMISPPIGKLCSCSIASERA